MNNDYLNLEKISDVIGFISQSLSIKMNVSLSSYNSDGTRRFFYNEYEYDKNGTNRFTIKRSYDYYISIESISSQNKIFIMISPSNFMRFKQILNGIITIFTDTKVFKNTFMKKNNDIKNISKDIMEFDYNALYKDYHMVFKPTIIANSSAPGISIHIYNTETDIVESVFPDRLIGIYDILKDLNLFMSAQVMLSSINIPIGTNRSSFDNKPSQTTFNYSNNNISGRFIQNKL